MSSYPHINISFRDLTFEEKKVAEQEFNKALQASNAHFKSMELENCIDIVNP